MRVLWPPSEGGRTAVRSKGAYEGRYKGSGGHGFSQFEFDATQAPGASSAASGSADGAAKTSRGVPEVASWRSTPLAARMLAHERSTPRAYELWHIETLSGQQSGPGKPPPAARLGSRVDAADPHAGNALLRHLSNRTDILIAAIGLHYPKCIAATTRSSASASSSQLLVCDTQFLLDLRGLSAACEPGRGVLGRRGIQCVMLEISPQHFASSPNGSWPGHQEGQGYQSAKDRTRENAWIRDRGCGPIASEKRDEAYGAYNTAISAAAAQARVPVARIFDGLFSLWRLHANKSPASAGDCTHWCSDDELWLVWHQALLAAFDQ